ncbi:hypothetical protein F5Y05DRAFT_414062 [Hypoxylon sp. FL0543]|nr:hypothetical protein F5Y05DRAFT_414062 [Hypoxylon sp. FL0543]
MNEALCSILSGEKEWYFDTEGRYIKFNQDGTGELWCRCNFNHWIVAHIEWKSIATPRDLNDAARTTRNTKGPQLLGQLNLEITLTKRPPDWVKSTILHNTTERCLTEDAFRSRTYTVKIEKGDFMLPCCIGYGSSSDQPRYALRLLFDISPYPPRSEWRKPEMGPDDCQFWDHREFVGRPAPDLRKRRRAMNDVSSSGWGECIVS